jgi:hypothetical protein
MGKFFYQTEQVRAWKENVLRVMTNYYLTLYNGIMNNKATNELANEVIPIIASLSENIFVHTSVPYLNGLSEFNEANLENISKSVAK